LRLIKGEIFGRTIDSGGGRKDDLFAACRVHVFQELDRAEDVLFVIRKRFLLGLTNGFKSSEMDHYFGAEIFNDPADSGTVGEADINVIEGAVG